MIFLTLKGASVAFLAVVVGHLALASPGDPVKVIFVNEFPNAAIDLYWEPGENLSDGDDQPRSRRLEASIPPRGGWHSTDTFTGHEFSYDLNDERHYVIPPVAAANGERLVVLAGDSEGFHVRCKIDGLPEPLDIIVKPYWAPRGAARFLELVRNRYYDRVAFHRVVPDFLLQFGIAHDYATRTREREVKIWDDFPQGMKFEPGMISFAGNGHDSRTTEVFIVMPGAPKEKLGTLGENSWEVPFGYIWDVNNSALKDIYAGHGDSFHVHSFSPFATSPDTSKIYEAEGYTSYLPTQFPELDYIDTCFIVGEVGISDHPSEGEL